MPRHHRWAEEPRWCRPDRHGGHLALTRRQRAKHLLHVLAQSVARQVADDVGDWPALVAVPHVEDVQQARREAPYAQVAAQEQDGDRSAVEQVGQVAVGAHQAVVSVIKLGIDGLQSSLRDCSSSFEVTSSSLADCSSSLTNKYSSFDDWSSSVAASRPSTVSRSLSLRLTASLLNAWKASSCCGKFAGGRGRTRLLGPTSWKATRNRPSSPGAASGSTIRSTMS